MITTPQSSSLASVWHMRKVQASSLSALLPMMSRQQYRHKDDAHPQILGAVPWYRNPGTPRDAVRTANGHLRHLRCVVISRTLPPLTAATEYLAPLPHEEDGDPELKPR
jgi:hypothetical protein